MPASHTSVATPRASRYLKQLCSHFDHKAESTFDDETGHTTFAFGEAFLTATEQTLDIKVSADDDQQLGRVEHVVGDHLERFAKRDGLTVNWQRD